MRSCTFLKGCYVTGSKMNLGARLNVDLDLSFQNQNSLVPCEHIRGGSSSKIVLIHTPERHLQVRLIADPEYTAEQRAPADIVGLGRCLARGPMPSILFAHTILPLSASPPMRSLGLCRSATIGILFLRVF